MKILIVSNLYPPHYLGGYELRCSNVAAGLRRRGHDVHVLTGTYGVPSTLLGFMRAVRDERDGVPIHRALRQGAYGPKLRLRPWTFWQARLELADARHFGRLLDRFHPDVVNWWSMNGLTKTLLPMPAMRGIPDMHFIEDPWMIREFGPDGAIASAFWRRLWDGEWGSTAARPFLRHVGRRWERHLTRAGIPTRHLPNRPRHVVFVSRYLEALYRDAGLTFGSTEIVHGGVQAERFLTRARRPAASGPLRLLYAGQISRDRGLHTLIDAIAHVKSELRQKLTLTVVGDGVPAYIADVHAKVVHLALDGIVVFRGKIAHDDMPALFAAHDVLVSPSTRHEGLPLTMAEAMLAECAVITTGSGGAMEMATLARLPVFPKNDPVALAGLLDDLVRDRQRVRAIAVRGHETARREFDSERMIDRIEAALRKLAEAPPTPCVATAAHTASPQTASGGDRLAQNER